MNLLLISNSTNAGANVACPTIRTTNDMPIIDPFGFYACNCVPFQINPHYLDEHPEGHAGGDLSFLMEQ